MTDHTMRDDLNEVKQHAREAARSTLMAMRSAVDFVLNKLDGDGEPVKGDPADRMTPTGTPDTPDETPPPTRDV
jgi:hypothetical protein